jgi:tetratricopeptide (TPR) repeat protein
VAAATAGAAAAIAVLVAHPDVVNLPSSAVARGDGWLSALLIASVCVVTGAAYVLMHRLLARRLQPSRRVGLVLAAVASAAVAVAVVATHPVARFEAFKEPPRPLAAGGNDFVRAHLLAGTGSGRWQFWDSALTAFRAAPLKGHGAGSYEAWWAAHGTIPVFVRDAHSVYLEALAELGLGGLLLIAVFVVGIVVAVRRARRSEGPERALIAALGASFVAYAVGAGIDWMWELTVVSVVGLVLLGLLTGPATHERRRPQPAAPVRTRVRRVPVVAVALASVWLLICAQAVPLLAHVKIGDSQEAARRGDRTNALVDASAARKLEPWASSPYLQVALVLEDVGDLRGARTWIGYAIERDRNDWRLWLVAARIETKQGAIKAARASLARAKSLNPRSPLFRGTGDSR